MTLMRSERFAFIPKRCDYCHRLFWLEGYDIRIKLVGIEWHPLEKIVCKECKGGNTNG